VLSTAANSTKVLQWLTTTAQLDLQRRARQVSLSVERLVEDVDVLLSTADCALLLRQAELALGHREEAVRDLAGSLASTIVSFELLESSIIASSTFTAAAATTTGSREEILQSLVERLRRSRSRFAEASRDWEETLQGLLGEASLLAMLEIRRNASPKQLEKLLAQIDGQLKSCVTICSGGGGLKATAVDRLKGSGTATARHTLPPDQPPLPSALHDMWFESKLLLKTLPASDEEWTVVCQVC
jgi:hypothetical protein